MSASSAKDGPRSASIAMPAPTTPTAITACIRAARRARGIIRGKVVDLLGPDRTFLGQTYDDGDPRIVCPWHGWEYRLLTGECAPDPSLRLKSYEVVERDGGIYVVA